MHKNTNKRLTKSFLDFAGKIKTWHPVERNGWIVKFSTFRDTHILLFLVSAYTAQTIVRYFSHEDEAVKYINYVIELNPAEEHDL